MNVLTRTRQLTLLSVLSVALLAGCTTTVTVVSDPEGAVITNRAGTVSYGYAPVEVPFDKKALEATIDPTDPQQCAKIQGFTAKWLSGASAQTETPLYICDLKFGKKIYLKRPGSVPAGRSGFTLGTGTRTGSCTRSHSRKRALRDVLKYASILLLDALENENALKEIQGVLLSLDD